MLTQELNLKKILFYVLLIYVVVIVVFYFLAGDQLRFRASRGNVTMLSSDSGTAELSQGVVVDQAFKAKIQKLHSISAQFSGNYRTEQGTVTMQLLKGEDVLLNKIFDTGEIQRDTILSVDTADSIENVYDVPLTLRIYSETGTPVTVLMNSSEKPEDYSLTIAGEAAQGTLCFSAEGSDYIWTGLHYWKFAIALGLFLVLMMLMIGYRYKKGQRSFVIAAIFAVKKYRFLIRQLVARDFKKKYKRSVLGVFWSFLNPLLMMLVQYFVFSNLFKSDIPNFAAYLITGTVMFNFFTEACSLTLLSIIDNSILITKVYMPKYIYPLTRTISSLVNFAISLIPMLLVCILTGVVLHKSVLLTLFFFICLFVFSLGLGMLLCTSMVFFRDTMFLWNVVSLMWMYITPLFYPEKILPENIRGFLWFNPIYHFVTNVRICILEGISPEPVAYFRCMGIALAMLVIGAAVFYKNQNRFVLYL